MGRGVQQGADQSAVQLAGATLVLRLGLKAGDAAALVVGIEGEVQADGGLWMPETKHMREPGCLFIIVSPCVASIMASRLGLGKPLRF